MYVSCRLQHVIERERKGDYLGKTVQVVPHITDAIQDWIEEVAKVPVDGKEGCPDVCVIELGGTVGDIESSPFVEALRQVSCSCDSLVASSLPSLFRHLGKSAASVIIPERAMACAPGHALPGILACKHA